MQWSPLLFSALRMTKDKGQYHQDLPYPDLTSSADPEGGGGRVTGPHPPPPR